MTFIDQSLLFFSSWFQFTNIFNTEALPQSSYYCSLSPNTAQLCTKDPGMNLLSLRCLTSFTGSSVLSKLTMKVNRPRLYVPGMFLKPKTISQFLFTHFSLKYKKACGKWFSLKAQPWLRVELDTPERLLSNISFSHHPASQPPKPTLFIFFRSSTQILLVSLRTNPFPPSQSVSSVNVWWFVLEAQDSSGWTPPDNSVHIRTAHSINH